MFRTRLLSGIVLVILAVALIISGSWILLGSTLIISCIGMYELYRVFKIEKSSFAIISYLAAVVYFLNLGFNFLDDRLLILIAYMILLMCIYVFSYPKYTADNVMTAFFGLFYVAIMLSFVYEIRMLDKGVYLAFLIFLCSWGCDTCAYCVGKLCNMTIGTHKMAPILSPKKSIEGAVGGVVGSALLTAIYGCVFKTQMNMDTNEIIILALIAAVSGLISMIGDLTASAIKRNHDVKDYGNLIPGHGGILDRFDSMIITAPIIYYLAVYFLV